MKARGDVPPTSREPLDLYGRPWEPREYLIVLAAYFQNRNPLPASNSELVRDIAALLGRTPAAVLMRMENFASLDGAVHRVGLVHVSPECRRRFEEWKDRPEHLIATADFLREEMSSRTQLKLFDMPLVKLPKAFQHYELLESIGRGAFGEVFSCVQRETGKAYAFKIIRADQAGNAEILGRFAREIRALKAIECPQIVRVYEDNIGEESRYPAFIMDLAVTSLSCFIEKNALQIEGSRARPRLPIETALAILRSIICAVKVLHSKIPLIVHRDINPNNILQLPDGRWVLADFGLAKFLPANISSTLSSQTQRGWGTIHYAPPEQREFFRYTDQKADIYALGILLWDLFSTAWHPPRLEDTGLQGPLSDLFRFAAAEEYDQRCPSIDDFSEIFEAAVRQIPLE